MKAFAKQFYRSKAWRACRAAYIAQRLRIDGGLCEECRDQQGYIVHHLVQLTPDNIGNPAVTLNHSLLAYVCKDCHDRYEGHGLGRGKSMACAFDADGQPVDRRRL